MSSSAQGSEIDFLTFIMSLAASALLQMGETDGAGTVETPVDMAMAKQTIEIIAMLREKTRGNLTADEDRLVETALYDLRLKYLHRSKQS